MPTAAKPSSHDNLQAALLAWYAKAARPLPWRDTTDPYRIWLAEVMLQQTTVTAVLPYYARFLARFPTLKSLAEAPLQEVLQQWQGLGYYRRAHLLHKCAQEVQFELGGHWPDTLEGLRELPSFGAYTAGAVASCAYNLPALAIDGNVVRVLSRLLAYPEIAKPTSAPLIKAAQTLAGGAPPRIFTNAMMELGSQICTPKNPQCLLCPLQSGCAAFAQGTPTTYPIKAPKKIKPHYTGVAYVLTDAFGNIWLRQRPNTGLLSSLWEVPHTGWEATPLPVQIPDVQHECGTITHVFTHFTLVLEVRRTAVETIPATEKFSIDDLPPLPSLMQKVLLAAGL